MVKKLVDGTEYRIILARTTKKIWKGMARAVHLTPKEQINGNSIVFVLGHSYGLPEPHACISIAVAKMPDELIMEKDHTLWIGEYNELPGDDVLWRKEYHGRG